ncbi:MAG: substrate-binding domain-containing protein, partial [Thermoproteus sp.]
MDAKMLAVGLVVGLLLGFAVSYAVLGASRAAPQVQTVTMTIGPQVQTVTVTATGTSTGAGAAFTVGAAGTLKFSFNELLSIYSQLYPSVALGQPLYEGSGKLAQDESVSKQFAVVAAADTTTIPSVLFKNGLADYEIAFGLTQMAIIVNL